MVSVKPCTVILFDSSFYKLFLFNSLIINVEKCSIAIKAVSMALLLTQIVIVSISLSGMFVISEALLSSSEMLSLALS